MRLNKYLALYAGLSRRSADKAMEQGRVTVDGHLASLGQAVTESNLVMLDGKKIVPKVQTQTIMLNKPVGYVCSRAGQGSKTIYDLLPKEFHNLKPVGRLDKDSSGLILLTNDGQLANRLTHPRYQKTKVYEIEIDRPLSETDFNKITKSGVDIGDNKPSKFQLAASTKQQAISKEPSSPSNFLPDTCYWSATLTEGRNRQIRRTFSIIGYKVIGLHRISFENYYLKHLSTGSFQKVN